MLYVYIGIGMGVGLMGVRVCDGCMYVCVDGWM